MIICRKDTTELAIVKGLVKFHFPFKITSAVTSIWLNANNIIQVVVDEDDPLLCRPDQIRHESVSVEDLSVVEDALYRRKCGTDKKAYLFFRFGDSLL